MTALQIYTTLHAMLSIVALTSGILVVKGLIGSAGRQLWTALFLVAAAATTLTGFFFPYNGVTPELAVGAMSMVSVALAFVARYRHRLAGAWRGVYVITVVITFYFTCFVLAWEVGGDAIPPIAHVVALVLFIALGILSFKRYHPKKLDNDIATSYVSPRQEVDN